MATKKDHKRLVVRRVRRALNLAESPPMKTNRKLLSIGYGQGASLKHVDAKDAHDIYDYAYIFELSDMGYCCDWCEVCPFDVPATQGEGWTFEADSENNNVMEKAMIELLIAV